LRWRVLSRTLLVEAVQQPAGRFTVSELGGEWLANRRDLEPSSWKSLEVAWRVHVEPAWGHRAIGSIRHSEVQAWVRRMSGPELVSRSATKVKRAHCVLAGVLDRAMRDRRIASNPARGVLLPRKTRKACSCLTVEQVELLASIAREHGSLVQFLAYIGTRWGEATGRRIRNLDLKRRRARIEENAVKVANRIFVGTPKTHEARSVPIPPFLVDALAIASKNPGTTGTWRV
jgi:integrase